MAANTAGPTLEEAIERLIASGRFESRQDVLREGVRLIEAEEADWAEVDAGILRGIDDADADRFQSAEAVFERLTKKYKSMAQTA